MIMTFQEVTAKCRPLGLQFILYGPVAANGHFKFVSLYIDLTIIHKIILYYHMAHANANIVWCIIVFAWSYHMHDHAI